VFPGIYLRVFVAITSWKGLFMTVGKICTKDFNGLLEKSKKGRHERTSDSRKMN
jgi:hypothetical protein